MKKITFFIFLMFVGVLSYAQSVDEPANWPNADWTITGTYDDTYLYENPSDDSSSFSFDDDDAGSTSDNDVAAESPVIDITAAQTNGETLYFSAQYVYREYIVENYLAVQYWDEDAAEWIDWIDPITESTPGAPTTNFCTGPYETILSDGLDVSGFTTTQLTNFKYRIYYDDDDGYTWGFCVTNPSIYSSDCPYPSDFTADNITSDSVDLSWTENGSATKWNIEYGEAGYTQGGEDSEVVPTTVNPYTLEDLEPNTTYELYIQANCGGGSYSVWIGPITITTECVAFDTPYEEDFTDSTTSIPSCWSQAEDDTANWSFSNNYYNVGDGMSGSGGYYAYAPTYPYDLVATLNTPLLDVSSLTTPSLSFFFNSEAGSYQNATIEVDFYDGAAWNEDIFTNNDDTNEWEYVMIDLSSYTITGDVQFRFTVTGPGSYHTDAIAIDDVVVDEYTDCLPVSELTVNATTSSSAGLAWTENGAATAWVIEYGLTGFEYGSEDGTVIDADSNPFSIDELESNTEYDFYVYAACSDDETSIVIGPFTFKTDCDAMNSPYTEGFGDSTSIPDCWSMTEVTTYPYGFQFGNAPWNFGNTGETTGSTDTGGNMVSVDDSYLDADETWSLITPSVDVSGLVTPSLLFYLNSHDDGNPDYGNCILTVDIFDGTEWQEAVFTNDGNTSGWEYINIDLSGYEFTGAIKARFNVTGSSSYYDDLAIDDVTFDELPDCSLPSDLAVSNVTAYTADFTWTENGYAEMWNLEYGAAGYTQGSEDGIEIEAYENPTTLEDLSPGTSYDVYLQSNCESSTSGWYGPITFTTACLPFDDFIENFDDESYASGDMVDCWSELEPGASSVGVYTWASVSGDNSMQIYNSGATGDVMLITPQLNALSEGTNRAKFYARTYSTGATLELGTITDPTDPTTFTLVETVDLIGDGTFYQYIVNFNEVTDDMYVAVKHGATATYQTILIDDFTWEPLPTEAPLCATNVVATPDEDCGNYANSITWDQSGDADGYYISIGTTAGGTDVVDSENLGYVSSYTFEGAFNSTYYYTVTPYNFAGSADCTEYSFDTAVDGCYCENVPSTVSLNGITDVSINGTDYVTTSSTYEDFTDTSADIYQGLATNLEMVLDSYSNYNYEVWIDLNDDYVFSDDESLTIGTSNSPSSTIYGSFTLADDANLGEHRMRIVTVAYYYDTDACESEYSGMVMDFTVNVTTADCTPPEYSSLSVSHDCENETFTVDVEITDLGDGSPEITDGTTTWDVETTGTYSVGPFDYGTAVSLELLHGTSEACNTPIGNYSYDACPPVNDDLCGATELTVLASNESGTTSTDSYTLAAATSQANEPIPDCFNNGLVGSIWFSFTVPADSGGNITVTTDISGATNTDTEIAVYEADGVACGDLSTLADPIGCDQDSGTAVNFNSVINFDGSEEPTLTPGATYYIQVDYWGSSLSTGTFAIEAIDNDALSSTSFEEFGFAYYPNPVKQDKLTLTAQKEISDVNVFNLLGQRVMTLAPETNEYVVDMSQLTAGTYFVEVVIDNKSETLKIIKE